MPERAHTLPFYLQLLKNHSNAEWSTILATKYHQTCYDLNGDNPTTTKEPNSWAKLNRQTGKENQATDSCELTITGHLPEILVVAAVTWRRVGIRVRHGTESIGKDQERIVNDRSRAWLQIEDAKTEGGSDERKTTKKTKNNCKKGKGRKIRKWTFPWRWTRLTAGTVEEYKAVISLRLSGVFPEFDLVLGTPT